MGIGIDLLVGENNMILQMVVGYILFQMTAQGTVSPKNKAAGVAGAGLFHGMDTVCLLSVSPVVLFRSQSKGQGTSAKIGKHIPVAPLLLCR